MDMKKGEIMWIKKFFHKKDGNRGKLTEEFSE